MCGIGEVGGLYGDRNRALRCDRDHGSGQLATSSYRFTLNFRRVAPHPKRAHLGVYGYGPPDVIITRAARPGVEQRSKRSPECPS
jgi:hypothetical protein